MLTKKWMGVIALMVMVVLVACGGEEIEPTAVPVVEDAKTAVSEAEPAESEPINMVDRQSSAAGRYSFMPVDGYGWEVAEGQTFMTNDDGTIMLSVVGVPANDGSAEAILADFIGGMATAGSGILERGVESTITVDGVEGTAVNLTGDLFGSPVQGQAILVKPTDDWAIFALAMGNVEENDARWRESGQPLFMTVLESILFLDETAVADLAATADDLCPIATDPTYGYSQDNPVQVGGDETDRAAYLDNLVDPVGIPVSYTYADSESYGGSTLSVYELSSPLAEKPVNLYIDEHLSAELMAPVGFSCAAAFTISAP
jgi:hypothetical protein